MSMAFPPKILEDGQNCYPKILSVAHVKILPFDERHLMQQILAICIATSLLARL